MAWNDRIRKAREDLKLTREQAAQKASAFLPEDKKVYARTLLKWENGITEPRILQAIALAKALGYEEVSQLYADDEQALNIAGLNRLEEYRQLLLLSPEFRETPQHTVRLLPVYMQPASAGTGQWLDDEQSELTEVDDSVPAKAEFGVRLAGDSMEPRFVNGQTVWARPAQTANNGDIVLCVLNEQGYCKKLRMDEQGAALISLNKKYAPIPIREEDDLRIAGIVVG